MNIVRGVLQKFVKRHFYTDIAIWEPESFIVNMESDKLNLLEHSIRLEPMKPFLLILALLGTLTSCVPATEQLPTNPIPITYQGTRAEVYTVILEIISADPGVPSYNPGGMDGYERGPSGPWVITERDGANERISAQATSSASGFLGSNAEPDVHELDVTLSIVGEDPPRTRVSVQGTPQAKTLAQNIYTQLDERFGGE